LICSSRQIKNLRYQQNLAGRRIAIIELPTNDLKTLLANAAAIQSAVDAIQPGQYLKIVFI
jgi:hypothetical protein